MTHRYRLSAAVWARVFWACVLWACTAVPSWAEGPTPRQQLEAAIPGYSPADMVMLPYGPNWIDLDGDGHRDLVMKSRIELPINNMHSAAIYTFHMYHHLVEKDLPEGGRDEDHPYPQLVQWSDWYPIPLLGRGEWGGGDFDITSHQSLSVGCILRDIRLLVHHNHKGKPKSDSYIILAERNFGKSYADVQPVTFTVYKLMREDSRAMTEFAFIPIATINSAANYCTVVKAFQTELDLGEHDEKGDFDVNDWKNR
jgi:hypothetical protein